MSPVLKRPKEKFTLPSKYLLFLLTLVCIGIMFLSFRTPNINTPWNSVVGVVIIPFQNGIAQIGSWITDKSDELIELRDVLEENQRLKDEVDRLTIENTKFQQERYELNQLRQLLKLDEEYSEYQKIRKGNQAQNNSFPLIFRHNIGRFFYFLFIFFCFWYCIFLIVML